MSLNLHEKSENEIDIREVLNVLWAHKIIIIFTSILSIFLASIYAQSLDKKFTSETIFKPRKDKNSTLPFGNEFGQIAALSGININKGSPGLTKEEINGRIFIQKIDALIDLRNDSYFNKYKPGLIDPIWKSSIKNLIGWQKSSNKEEIIWQGIVKEYSENVNLKKTIDGIMKVSVTHTNAKRASDISNIIVDTILSDTKDKIAKAQADQLDYLSNILLDAQLDLEKAQSKLKNFSIANGALPIETFALGSLRLEALREQLKRTLEIHNAAFQLLFLLEKNETTDLDYLTLRKNFPIVDQVEFRRVLGQSEIISSWAWPSKVSVNAVLETLEERRDRLQSQIDESQLNAEKFGSNLNVFAKLERDIKVAEATYEVLIEQVKAQSMLAGYSPDNSEIYEYAAPAIKPSSPNAILIIIIGFCLGLFFGCALALIISINRGVFYSKKLMIIESRTYLDYRYKPFISINSEKFKKLRNLLPNKFTNALRDMTVEIHKSELQKVVISSSNSKMFSHKVAISIAKYMQPDNIKIAVINFSKVTKKLNTDENPVDEIFCIM